LFGAATRQRLAEPVQFTETLGNGGLGTAAVMLVVVLAANLLLENFVEPKVMGRTLDIHPLVVLVVTALGGLLRRILD
jgi:putative heme transporter